MINKLTDKYNRVHDYLRISLTDKCNFNCLYCNPKESSLKGSNKNELLSFEEILRIIELFAGELNFKKFRFTGGEPLVRKGIWEFFEKLNLLKKQYDFKLGITTNASLLNGKTEKLKKLGFDSINISLDSLQKNKFNTITGINKIEKVLSAIKEAEDAGFNPVKVNTVVIKGVNDNEILDFVLFAKDRNINIRFIEFMPFTENRWDSNEFISYKEMKGIVEKEFDLIPLINDEHAVAKNYQLKGYRGKVSFISSISEHFCSTCNRVRISSKGDFRLCLFTEGKVNINFRDLIREGLSNEEIADILKDKIKLKWDKHPDVEKLNKEDKNIMKNIGG